MRKQLPQTGMSIDDVMSQLRDRRRNDRDWRGGRLPSYAFSGGEDVHEVSRRAFMEYFTENALGAARAFPSLKEMERDVIDMTLDLFHAPPEAQGNMTTGGSESIFLACKTCRDEAQRRLPHLTKPNIVAPETLHPAFNKAGDALNIEIRRVAVKDLRADPDAIAGAIDDATIMIVGSAPCFPYGVIDPIEPLSALALERGIWLHVDACVGGYFAPFARRLGRPIPNFDFSVPGVRSMSADLHKFGYAAKPASAVLYRHAQDHERQIFTFDDWPSGRFSTPNLSGTRAGGAVAAAWAVMNYLGTEGYLRIAERVLAMTSSYVEGIEAIEGLRMIGSPDLSIIAYTSELADIAAIGQKLDEKGWLVNYLRKPRGIHMMMSLLHEPARDAYLTDLREAVEATRGNSEHKQVEATY